MPRLIVLLSSLLLSIVGSSQTNVVETDWANLKRYAVENKRLGPPNANEQRVVFMGNSITEGWINADKAFFAGKAYINRGISGQTTPQMLIRFQQDVVDLKPAVVVILAGTNDIAENTGPITLEAIFDNIVSMAALAKANNIRVVLSSVLPVYTYTWRPHIKPIEKIAALNKMIKTYCTQNNIPYVDYYAAMVDERNGLDKKYTNDEVHPTLAGYKVMEPLVEKGIAAALKSK